MKGFKTTEDNTQIDRDAIERQTRFETEFNKLYCTKQYIEAFDLCISNMHDTNNRSLVKDKAMLTVRKLTNRIELSDKSYINQDWVMNILIKRYGINSIELKNNQIKYGTSMIHIANKEKICIESSSNISSMLIWCLFLCPTFIAIILAITIVPKFLLLLIVSLIATLATWASRQDHKAVIYYIAIAIVEEYYNH